MSSRRNLKLDDLVSIDNNPNNPTSTSSLNIDPNITPLQGEIAYLGPVSFADGEDWVGVRLTGDSKGHGKNDGTVRGRRYFTRCGLKGGIFVRAGRAQTTNRLEELRLKKEVNRRGIGLRAIGSNRSSASFNDSKASVYSMSSLKSEGSSRSRGSKRSSSSGGSERPRSARPSTSSSVSKTSMKRRPSTAGETTKKYQSSSSSTFNDTNKEQRMNDLTKNLEDTLVTLESERKQSAHLQSEIVALERKVEKLVGENELSLNEIALDKEGVEKQLKEVEMDLESANIKVEELRLELVGVRESVTIAEAHAEVEVSGDDDGYDGSSTVIIGITTTDKEEVSKSDAVNDVYNSNVNAWNKSNIEELAKDASTETLEDMAKRLVAMKIAETATFEELDEGYHHTTKWSRDEDGDWDYKLGEETTEYVKMDEPRSCSYQIFNDAYSLRKFKSDSDSNTQTEKIKKYETIIIGGSSSPEYTKPGVELRGITLRQLRAIMANINRRCVTEKWVNREGVRLDPKKVNLYDADTYVIRPYTVHSCKSLVERLPSTAGPQPPRFFVSHWWGESVYDFINCIEQFVRDFGNNESYDSDHRGGGMTADTPIWICAYSNNQWDLSDITVDPRESDSTKAMEVAKGRTITILDADGIVFTRIWNVYELYLTLTDSQKGVKNDSEKGLWAVYTAKKHTHGYSNTKEERESVGIISGGAPDDENKADVTTAREKHFPYQVISKALNIRVENADASVNDDRVHILNSIIGKSTTDIDDPPLEEHHKYTELNESLRSIFAASQASLQGAAKDTDEKWMAMLVALSKGTKKDGMRFDFGPKGAFSGLTATRATQLMQYLPLTIKKLTIQGANFGSEFMEALIQQVVRFYNLEYLEIDNTKVGNKKGGQEAGVRLAKVLATNTTIKELYLYTDLIGSDNVVEWGDALMENKTLITLDLDKGWVDEEMEEIIEKLQTKTKKRGTRTPSLDSPYTWLF